MEIKIEANGDKQVITLSGAFDVSSSQKVKDKFSEQLQEGNKNFIIDMGGVEFIDSTGLGALVGFFKKVKIGDGDLVLTKINQPVLKIFELTQLNKVFKIN